MKDKNKLNKNLTGLQLVSEIYSKKKGLSWPEFNCLTLDCKKVFEEIANYFKPYKVKKRIINRG